MEDRIYDYWVATLQDGYLGNLTELVRRAGGARSFYELSEDQMLKLGISQRLADYITGKKPDTDSVQRDYEELEKKGISYVNHSDHDFPTRLKDIPTPPYGLFVKGSLPDGSRPAVAVIGSRECSEYGRIMAEYFGGNLAKEGIDIISGMAWGIDGIAQSAALAAGGRSYGVLGCGVDITYPSRNMVLYRKLCKCGNGLISEYAPGTAAEARRFPPRNRLISGLCDVLIVVEARAKSGTLITVDMAIDQGRTVMVVPGRLTDSLSAGCINLMYQGALPATSIDTVMEQLGMTVISKRSKRQKCAAPDAKKKDEKKLPEDMRTVASHLTLDPKSTDEIAQLADMPVMTVMIILSKLEMEGIAKEVYPGRFVRGDIG